MLKVRPSNDRGHIDHGWLDTYHTFSFGDYHDPKHTRFRTLRVINEDWVAPGQGFGQHPHRDMEIITYILSGRLEHKDSLGNAGVIRPGQVQYMAAGSGILHSEFNPSPTEPVHLMQIWIMPNVKGAEPRYEQRDFPALGGNGDTAAGGAPGSAAGLTLLASGDGRDGSIRINQDASMLAGTLRPGEKAVHAIASGRAAWVQVLTGKLTVRAGDGDAAETLTAGDAAAITDAAAVEIEAGEEAEILLFDLN